MTIASSASFVALARSNDMWVLTSDFTRVKRGSPLIIIEDKPTKVYGSNVANKDSDWGVEYDVIAWDGISGRFIGLPRANLARY